MKLVVERNTSLQTQIEKPRETESESRFTENSTTSRTNYSDLDNGQYDYANYSSSQQYSSSQPYFRANNYQSTYSDVNNVNRENQSHEANYTNSSELNENNLCSVNQNQNFANNNNSTISTNNSIRINSNEEKNEPNVIDTLIKLTDVVNRLEKNLNGLTSKVEDLNQKEKSSEQIQGTKASARETNKRKSTQSSASNACLEDDYDNDELTEDNEEEAPRIKSYRTHARKRRKKESSDVDLNCVDFRFKKMIKEVSFIVRGNLVTRPERAPNVKSHSWPKAVAALVFSPEEQYYGSFSPDASVKHTLKASRIDYFKCCLIKGLTDHYGSYEKAYLSFSRDWPKIYTQVNQKWRDFKSKWDKRQGSSPPPFSKESFRKCKRASCNLCIDLPSSPTSSPLNPYDSRSVNDTE